MKIFRVTLNRVLDTPHVVVSSYRAERQKQKEEFFLYRTKAEARQKELYDGAHKLLGYIPNFEAVIDEIDVNSDQETLTV